MRRVFAALRDGWFILLIAVLLLALTDGLLHHALPGVEDRYRIDPEVRHFNRWESELYRDDPRAVALRQDHAAAKTMRWHSYVYWRRAPHASEHYNINEAGIRATWTGNVDASSPLVFVMGGSTVWGTGVSDDDTLPSQVAQVLDAAGYRLRVVNFGESGWVSTQGLIALTRELQAGNVPDVVVFYDGVNDVAAALQEGTAGTPQNESQRRLKFNLTRGAGARYAEVVLQELQGIRKLARVVTGDGGAPDWTPDLPGRIVAAYAANMRAAAALAEQWDFEVLFYWQPVIFTKRTLSGHERRARDFMLQAHRDLHLATNREIAASPQLRSMPQFHDVSGIFDDVEQPVYIDFCHVGVAGNARVARRISADLRAVLDRTKKS